MKQKFLQATQVLLVCRVLQDNQGQQVERESRETREGQVTQEHQDLLVLKANQASLVRRGLMGVVDWWGLQEVLEQQAMQALQEVLAGQDRREHQVQQASEECQEGLEYQELREELVSQDSLAA